MRTMMTKTMMIRRKADRKMKKRKTMVKTRRRTMEPKLAIKIHGILSSPLLSNLSQVPLKPFFACMVPKQLDIDQLVNRNQLQNSFHLFLLAS